MGELVFVYNANGGIVNGIMDSMHKLLSPRTYMCSRCAITYGLVSMKREWKEY